MKAWIYVEGPSDRLGLEALWNAWINQLSSIGRGIVIIPLKNKSNFLRKFGEYAAEKLVANQDDVVVGMPDLYPILPDQGSADRHTDSNSLKNLQKKKTVEALVNTQGLKLADAKRTVAQRLLPGVFKHDFEMLLLAAKEELRQVLGTPDSLANSWTEPVENQNLNRPPKRVVEDLFRTKSRHRKSYVDTRDGPAVLRKVRDLSAILKTSSRQCTCPEFVTALRWLGERLGEHCCSLT